MPLRSPSLPIRELIRNLASSDPARVQAARARLAVLGGRAVEGLIEALEGGNDRLKLLAMPLLTLIRDNRAQGPLIALLMDRELKIREAAARALARFPGRETIARLEKVLKEEPRVDVRVAAVQSLVTLFDDGSEEALREVLSVLFDREESRKVRLTAFSMIPHLSARGRRAILKKLREDPDKDIAARARSFEDIEDGRQTGGEDVVSLLACELASTDYLRWNAAMHKLIALGSRTLVPLIAQMRARHEDREFNLRAAMVLKGLGPRRVRPLSDLIETVLEPLPLELLVEVVANLGDRPQIYRLRDLIAAIDARSSNDNGHATGDPYARVRGKAHLALARIGSRVAIHDLKKTLVDPARRLEADLLTAAARIGTRNELGDLVAAYRREDPWMRARIRDAFWQILRREKIRPRIGSFESLTRQDREILAEILEHGRSSGASPLLPGLRPRWYREIDDDRLN